MYCIYRGLTTTLDDQQMRIDTQTSTPLGRPRSESARKAILDSALQLSQQQGDVSIKAIAAAAGVSRQTVYRWWDNRGQILLEALLEVSTTIQVPSTADSVDKRIREFVHQTVKQANAVHQALSIVMLDAQGDEAFAERFRTDFILPRRAAFLAQLGEHAEVFANKEKQFLADLVYGPLWYRVLVKHAEIDRFFASQLVDAALEWYYQHFPFKP